MSKPAPKTNEISLKVGAYIDQGVKNDIQYMSLKHEVEQLKNSDRAAAFNSLGLLYDFQGYKSLAIEAFRTASNLESTNPRGWFNYAKALLISESHEEAAFYAKKALFNASFEEDYSTYAYLYMLSLILKFDFKEVSILCNDSSFKRFEDIIKKMPIYGHALIALKQINLFKIQHTQIRPIADALMQVMLNKELVADGLSIKISEEVYGFQLQIFVNETKDESDLMNKAFLDYLDMKGISSSVKNFIQVKFFSSLKSDSQEESRCPMTGMTEERSEQLSIAMIEAIEKINPRKQRFVRA